MSVAPVPVTTNTNKQAIMPKNIVLDPGQFNRDQTKFEDWQRGMRLFLKRNRVMETDDRITVILAHLRGGVAGIYAQKKLNELSKELETQDWKEFIKEIKTMFSNKTKATDTEWKIETFKQEKQNTVDFMIEFEALAMKADTDELYAIFLLKKNISSKQYWNTHPLQHQSHSRNKKQQLTQQDKGMSLWKDIRIIKQEQKEHTVDEDSLWILERATITSKTESQNTSIVTSIGIWLKMLEQEERERNQKVFQMQQRGTHHKGL